MSNPYPNPNPTALFFPSLHPSLLPFPSSLPSLPFFIFSLLSLSLPLLLSPPFPSSLSTGEAVFARCLSSLKNERVEASKHLSGPAKTKWEGDRKAFIEDIRQALYASKIISYAQGFMLLREAAKVYNWKLNYGGIALMWRGGCIIRR